jgi:hypothetical protein
MTYLESMQEIARRIAANAAALPCAPDPHPHVVQCLSALQQYSTKFLNLLNLLHDVSTLRDALPRLTELRVSLTGIKGYSAMLLLLTKDNSPPYLYQQQCNTLNLIEADSRHLIECIEELIQACRLEIRPPTLKMNVVRLDKDSLLAFHCRLQNPMNGDWAQVNIRADVGRLIDAIDHLSQDVLMRSALATWHISVRAEGDTATLDLYGAPYEVSPVEVKALLEARSHQDIFNIHLFWAKALVELQGGTFDYAFEEGITFILRFPIAPAGTPQQGTNTDQTDQ